MQPEYATWNYLVLADSAAFEFYSWVISYKELRCRKDPNETVFDEIVGSKDPTVFTVFLEDSAGLLGAFLAFLGIFLSKQFNNPLFDPLASILIGILLAFVALLLGRETGALLVGERTNRSRIGTMRQIIVSDPAVERVGNLFTMQMGPQQALLNVEIRFKRTLEIDEVELAIQRVKKSIRQQEPTVERIFVDPDPFSTGTVIEFDGQDFETQQMSGTGHHTIVRITEWNRYERRSDAGIVDR